LALALTLTLTLTGCSLPQTPPTRTTYDLGPLAVAEPAATAATKAATTAAPPATATGTTGPLRQAPLRLAPTTAPAALASTDIGYRLLYAQPLQPRSYTLARWSMPPAQLVHQRLQTALVAAGWPLSTHTSPGTPELQVEVHSFEHVFQAPERSQALVQWRASLRHGRTTLAQHTITTSAPAPTPDAAGGTHALADATQQATTQLLQWLASQRQPAAGDRQP
jgi:cholesterol transport system auxiliary component